MVPLIVALLVAFGVARRASGQERQTLLQWSYGTSFSGGPNLYEPLATDRPDFTEASVTVGRGVVQVETGYTFTHNDDGGERTQNHSFPESLLRMGLLADWLEFRTNWNYAVERTEAGGAARTQTGAEDLSLGVKLALTPQEAVLPETAVVLQMSVPSGADAFSSDKVMPGVNYLYGWDVVEDWTLAGSTGVNPTTDDVTADIYTKFSQSLTVGHSWSSRLGSYCEWYVLSPIGADTNRTENYVNGGLTALINNDVQWDVRVGVGLNSAADDFFAGTGLSLRYW